LRDYFQARFDAFRVCLADLKHGYTRLALLKAADQARTVSAAIWYVNLLRRVFVSFNRQRYREYPYAISPMSVSIIRGQLERGSAIDWMRSIEALSAISQDQGSVVVAACLSLWRTIGADS